MPGGTPLPGAGSGADVSSKMLKFAKRRTALLGNVTYAETSDLFYLQKFTDGRHVFGFLRPWRRIPPSLIGPSAKDSKSGNSSLKPSGVNRQKSPPCV